MCCGGRRDVIIDDDGAKMAGLRNNQNYASTAESADLMVILEIKVWLEYKVEEGERDLKHTTNI